jgi:hypothetical protein
MKNVQDFCAKHGITEAQFYGREEIKGYLDLRSLTSVPDGFNPTVGGYLDLSGLTSVPDGFNPTVGGYLDLRSLTSVPDGFNPTVGGSLDLRSLTSVPDGFNPTVGGYLDLRSLTSVPGRLKDQNRKRTGNAIKWPCGKFIKADGIFTEILSKKGNVYTVREVGGKKTFYLVTDGNDNWAHGDTLKQAKDDLRFKIKADPELYRHLKADSVLKTDDAIAAYRGITGACATGTRMFLDGIKVKKQYTIAEIAEVTKGAFGNDRFKSFFGI